MLFKIALAKTVLTPLSAFLIHTAPLSTVTSATLLPTKVYEQKAQQVIKFTMALQQGMPKNVKEICEKRKKSARLLEEKKLGKENTDHAVQFVTSSWVQLFTLNLIECNAEARFLLSFSVASEQLLTHRIRKVLGCYTAELADFEKENTDIVCVTHDEYKKRLETIKPTVFEEMHIQEAGKLAETILQKLPINL